MKRFLSVGGSGPAPKVPKVSSLVPRGDPRTLIAWNVENLASRAQQNKREVQAFLATCGADVVFLSEVKLSAHCGVAKAKKGDGAPRNRRRVHEKLGAERAACLDLLDAGGFAAPIYSLADWKYAGTCCLLRSGGPVPRRVFFSLPSEAALSAAGDGAAVAFDDAHDADGRIMCLEYESLLVLHTYSPNNGSEANGFARRRDWEARIRAWVAAVAAAGRRLVYVGDLNVAPRDADLSHPAWFAAWNSNAPNKRFGKGPHAPLDPDDEGQPGCTPRERRFFDDLLAAGGLVDAYRAARGDAAPTLDGPYFSWRGPPGKDGPPETGRYWAKGMRIDHALVSASVSVDACDLLGSGFDRQGFFGSDHCPIKLVLAAEPGAAPVAAPADREPPDKPAPPTPPEPEPAPPPAPPEPEPPTDPEWACRTCTLLNEAQHLACDACGQARDSSS